MLSINFSAVSNSNNQNNKFLIFYFTNDPVITGTITPISRQILFQCLTKSSGIVSRQHPLRKILFNLFLGWTIKLRKGFFSMLGKNNSPLSRHLNHISFLADPKKCLSSHFLSSLHSWLRLKDNLHALLNILEWLSQLL